MSEKEEIHVLNIHEMPMQTHPDEVVKYFDQVMPIIVCKCGNCQVELFKSMMYEPKTLHINLCIDCYDKLKDKEWKYDNLCK